MVNSYLLVDKYTDQSSGEKMCIIFNFMNDFPHPLKEVDLRSLISNGEVNLINANNQSLEFRGSQSALEAHYLKYLSNLILDILKNNNMSFDIPVSVLQMLKVVTSMQHLSGRNKVFVQDLLRILTSYFEYMIDEKVDVTNLVSDRLINAFLTTQLVYDRSALVSNMYGRHKTIITSINTRNGDVSRWLQEASKRPCAYNVVVFMLKELCNRAYLIGQYSDSIGKLISVLEEFFNNIKYSPVGLHMYKEYLVVLGNACDTSVRTKAYEHSNEGISIPSLSASVRKNKIGRCSIDSMNNYKTYLQELEAMMTQLNTLIESYGATTTALLTSIPRNTYQNSTIVSEDVYKNQLNIDFKKVKELFAKTRKFAERKQDINISAIATTIGIVSTVISACVDSGFWANNQALTNGLIWGGAAGSVWASRLEISRTLRDNITKSTLAKANKKTKAFLKKFKDFDKSEIAVLMYKLNKISYFKSSTVKRLPFIYYNYYEFMHILNPMQFLTTKNTDVEKKVQFRDFKILCDELDEDLLLDISWCTMFYFGIHRLKNKDNLYRKLPSVLWGIFEDIFDLKVDAQNPDVKEKIKVFLIRNCGWYISDSLKSFSLKEKRVW